MKKQSFLYGASILAIASLLCKIMSAILKIPLDRFFLHEEGIAIYQSAYTIYNVFLAICVTGIPIALSSIIAKSEEDRAESLCKSTFAAVSIFTGIFGVLLIVFSAPLARVLSGGREPLARTSLIILALSLPFMGIISSRRGYFQGKSDMRPSAISQLAESLIKVVLGIGVCSVTVKYGIEYGAAGAISGVALGAVAAAAVLEIFYRKNKKGKEKASFSDALRVVKLSVPMTLGAFAFTGVMLADTLTVPKILAGCGMGVQERMQMMGYLTRANTVYNLPATIITAFTASAVPSVASAIATGDKVKISDNTKKVIKLIFLVSIPCMLAMVVFSKEILSLLYSSAPHWQLLALAGVMALVMPYIQTTSALLQTFGKVWIPIAVSMGAVILKIVLNFFLVKELGIEGAPLATVCMFLIVFVINTLLLSKCVSLKGTGKTVFKIAVCGIAAFLVAVLVYQIKKSTLFLVGAAGFAVIIYAGGIILTGCIKKEEFLSK